MFTNTIQLLNDFLEITDFSIENYFHEYDFNTRINNDMGIIYPNEEFALSEKCQLIHHKGLSFCIYIICVVEKSTDKLYAISFGCKDIHSDESMIIVDYVHTLIIQFSSFVNQRLYEGLKDYTRLEQIYLSTCIRLAQKINETDSDEKQYIIDDYQFNSEYCQLDCNLYLTIFLHENGLLNYLLISGENDDA
ncbi:MAG: hypothetical protein LUF02_01025 [Erysipelotrichaceae bacterium]|nr:hypothetical protein [Erysipelotrichaceae bacterium]